MIIEVYYSYFDKIDSIEALYLIDLDSRKIRSKIVNENHNREEIVQSIKDLLKYISKHDFDMIYVESKEYLFVKNIPNKNSILIVVTNSNIAIGSIFNILKKLP